MEVPGIEGNLYLKVNTFIYLDSLLANQNSIYEERKCRIKAGNSSYYSVQTLLSSQLRILKLKYINNNIASCAIWL